MKRFLLIFLLNLSLLLFTVSLIAVQAQEVNSNDNVNVNSNATLPDTTSVIITDKPLQAEAGPDKNAAVGRNVVFNATGSTGPTGVELIYQWDFGDGQGFQGIDASHIYNEPGVYKAKLTVLDGKTTSKDTVLVSVAQDIVLLITDKSVPKEIIKQHRQYAQRNGVLLLVVRPRNESRPTYAVAQDVAEQLITFPEDLNQAKLIIVWTERNMGLTALTEVSRLFASASEETQNPTVNFKQKTIIRLDEKPTSVVLARLAQTTFNTVQPNYILLTTIDALGTILSHPNTTTLPATLKGQNVPYRIISSHSQRVLDNITLFNFTSYGINYLINQGISQDTLFLLLVLPVVATIVAIARQVVGVKAFGIYVPSIIALTFVITQLKYGLVIFLVLLATATVARIGIRYLRLLYLPRMALVLSTVAFAIFIMFIVAAYFRQTNFFSISIFPILVMIILTEKFVEVQIEQGNKTAIFLTLETLVLAIVSYEIITWDKFENLILAYPEIIIGITIVINILLGRFTGLRMVEYFRFRKLLKQKSS